MQELIYSKRAKQRTGMSMMYLKGIERSSLIGMEGSFILNFIGREGNLLSQDCSGGLDMPGQGF